MELIPIKPIRWKGFILANTEDHINNEALRSKNEQYLKVYKV